MKKGGIEHEHTLKICKSAAISQGMRVIDLRGKSPDLIIIDAVTNHLKVNCIDAVNANSKGTKPRSKNDNLYHIKMKRKLYESLGFDNVQIVTYTASPVVR